MKLNWGTLAVVSLLIFAAPVHAQGLKTLSGRVSRTDASHELLYVNFTNPATDVVHEMPFRVTHETGMNGYHGLETVKPDEIVTVDYEESGSGELKALYVAKFRQSGPPIGLEKFKGL